MTAANPPTIEELRPRWGARIRAERQRLKMTQKQLAKRTGVSQATISAIENGIYDGRFATRYAIERELGLTSPELLSGEAS